MKDNVNTAVNSITVCTYIRHFKHSTLSIVDYVFALCNVPRFELVDTGTAANNYKESPSILKLRHDSGELIFFKHLPIDATGNNMAMSGLYAE